MDKKELVEQVNKAFDHLKDRRDNLFTASENVIGAKLSLELAKAGALLSGKIDGKNAEIRDAQVAALVKLETENVKLYEMNERASRFQYEIAQLELERVKMLLRILELDLE